MDDKILLQARTLGAALHDSEAYKNLIEAREDAFASESTHALLDEYSRLRMRIQGGMLAGAKDEELLKRFDGLNRLLQSDEAAFRYLMAELRMDQLLGDVYRILGESVDIQLDSLLS